MHPCRSGSVRCSFPPSMGMPPGSLPRGSRLRSEGDIPWQAWNRASRAAVTGPLHSALTRGGEMTARQWQELRQAPLPHTRGRGAAQVAGAAQRPPLPHTRGRGGSALLERAWCRLRRRAPGERRGSSQLPLAPAPISLRRDPSPWPHRALLIPVWKVSPFWLIYG